MKDNEGYDGSKLRVHEMWLLLEMEYERQMWAAWKRQYPNGFPWDKVIIGDGIKGKAMIVSTVDLDNSGQDFRKMWEDSPSDKESGLYRVFRPAWKANELGLKEEDQQSMGQHLKRRLI